MRWNPVWPRAPGAAPAALALLAALTCGCALSPQTVRMQPALDLSQLAPRAQGAAVALAVADARADKVVGYRGGIYATASITADPGMTDAVRAELARALGKLGYRVVDPGAASDFRLDVQIAGLGYAASEGSVTRTIETTAEVRATCTSGPVTRTGDYRDRRTKEMLKVPSEAENARMLNEVLSAALQRLAADPELFRN